MILYATTDGRYVALKKESGPGGVEVEVPTTEGREALATWLNGREAQIRHSLVAAAPAAPVAEGRCSLCQRDHAGAERAAAKLALGMEASHIAERILNDPAYAVAQYAEAVIRRLGELKEVGHGS